ncbi:MAG: hypothetical protein IT219_08035, partial [Bacteroidales bacterium]|nr:hypothetical protein [Bacteroidales bacterium]
SFIFAEEIVTILGGSDYTITANIFRIFCIYGLLLPIDRFIGIGLDSVNLPRKNFYKVVYMASFNIIGDSIVVFGLSFLLKGFSWLVLIFSSVAAADAYRIAHGFSIIKTLEMVAFVTILFTLFGIVIGYNYLNKEINLSKKAIFVQGFHHLSSFTNFFKK